MCVNKNRHTQKGMSVGNKVVISAGGSDGHALKMMGTRFGLGEGGKLGRLKALNKNTFKTEKAPGIEAPLGSWAVVVELLKVLDEVRERVRGEYTNHDTRKS